MARKKNTGIFETEECKTCCNLDNDKNGLYCMVSGNYFHCPPCPHYEVDNSKSRKMTAIEKEEYERLVKNSKQLKISDLFY